MELINKTVLDIDRQKIVPTGPGQTAHYQCRACKERFTSKVPVFFEFLMRCPKCGSFRVGRDPAVVY